MASTKTALITGANRGLGYACAHELLLEGYKVLLTGRNLDKLNKAKAELSSKHENANIEVYVCDVANPASIMSMVDVLKSKHRTIDLLINNAGIIGTPTAFPNTELDEIHNVLQTNLYGPFLLSKEVYPLLKNAQNGKIVNVSSGMGAHDETGSTGHTAYRLSKSSLNGLTDLLHRELQEDKIDVYSVCPGWVHTDMGGKSAPRTPKEGADSILAPALNNLPSGKFYRDGELINW